MKIPDRDDLVQRLLADPSAFYQNGESYELLQAYFSGREIESLRPLLRNSEALVRRVASFVLSEIGVSAIALIDDAVALLGDDDAHVRWNALESVMVCAVDGELSKFIIVPRQMQNENASIRRLAMRLVSNASDDQLESGIENCETLGESGKLHKRGLSVLIANSIEDVALLIDDSNSLLCKYGAIGGKRLYQKSASLLGMAAESSCSDARRFASEALGRLAKGKGLS